MPRKAMAAKLMKPWAATLPSYRHAPRVGQPCAVEACAEPLLAHEECYYVEELDKELEGLEQRAVCWRHVQPDQGPVMV